MPRSFQKDGITISVGDRVLLRPDAGKLPYIARIDKVGNRAGNSGYELKVTWFYRPEDVGRRQYHGEKELFMSDHSDDVHSASIISKCQVWSLDEYRGLETVTTTDFFWRYTYHTATRRFSPEQVPVYCSCELPENPDFFMAECDSCLNWFHPHPCEGVEVLQVQATGKFMCRKCRQTHAVAAAQASALALKVGHGAPGGLETSQKGVGGLGDLGAWQHIVRGGAEASQKQNASMRPPPPQNS